MSFIGNQPISQAFLTDQFSGNGTTTAFTMSVAPAGTTSLLVAITGVVQDPSAYSVTGTTLTFSSAPPSGTGNISVRYLGIPASGVTTTAYRTVTEFTATAGQTTFTPPSYTVGYLNVYRNGVLLGSADYTATNGTTVVLAAAASAGDLVTTESFYVSSVLNALPTSGGTLNGNLNVIGDETVTGNTYLATSSGNVGIGTSSPANRLDSYDSSAKAAILGHGYSVIGANANTNNGCIQVGASGSANLQLDYDAVTGGTGTASIYNVYSGALRFGTANTERMRIDSSGNVSISQTPGKYTIDSSPLATSIANGGTVDFPNASGMLVVNNYTTGGVSIYLFGGGSTAIIGSVVGAVGSTAYNAGIAGYRWTNNSGATATFGFFFVRTRPTA